MSDTTTPTGAWPTRGTDNYLMLEALIAAAPNPAWNLDAGLHIKANSRAAELRKLGWQVTYVSRARAHGDRKRDHGYKLLNPPTSLFGKDVA